MPGCSLVHAVPIFYNYLFIISIKFVNSEQKFNKCLDLCSMIHIHVLQKCFCFLSQHLPLVLIVSKYLLQDAQSNQSAHDRFIEFTTGDFCFDELLQKGSWFGLPATLTLLERNQLFEGWLWFRFLDPLLFILSCIGHCHWFRLTSRGHWSLLTCLWHWHWSLLTSLRHCHWALLTSPGHCTWALIICLGHCLWALITFLGHCTWSLLSCLGHCHWFLRTCIDHWQVAQWSIWSLWILFYFTLTHHHHLHRSTRRHRYSRFNFSAKFNRIFDHFSCSFLFLLHNTNHRCFLW